jgi:hypothetical protein
MKETLKVFLILPETDFAPEDLLLGFAICIMETFRV